MEWSSGHDKCFFLSYWVCTNREGQKKPSENLRSACFLHGSKSQNLLRDFLPVGFPGLRVPRSLLKKLNSRQIHSIFQIVYINLIWSKTPSRDLALCFIVFLGTSKHSLQYRINLPEKMLVACLGAEGCKGWSRAAVEEAQCCVEPWPRRCSAGCSPPLHHSLVHRAGHLLAADDLLWSPEAATSETSKPCSNLQAIVYVSDDEEVYPTALPLLYV